MSLPMRTTETGAVKVSVEFTWGDMLVLDKAMREHNKRAMKSCPPGTTNELTDLADRIARAYRDISEATR